jgi:hypothetical protein
MPALQASEATLHLQVTEWLRIQHPTVIFRTDFASGLKLSVYQAALHKRVQSGRAWPDIFIYEPRGKYHGCAIELKSEKATLFLKGGGLTTNPHIREQAVMLDDLRERGYYAEFAQGFAQFQVLVNYYLRLRS